METVICYCYLKRKKFIFGNCQLSTVTLVTPKNHFWKLLYCYIVTLGLMILATDSLGMTLTGPCDMQRSLSPCFSSFKIQYYVLVHVF